MDAEVNYILSEIQNLDHMQMVGILNIVNEHNQTNLVMEKSDGSRLQLQKLPERVVLRIYNYMKSLLNYGEE